MKPSQWFSKLKNAPITLSSKIEIVLKHYGWAGKLRKEFQSILIKVKEYGYQLFPSAITLIEQFYGLHFPCKSSDSRYGTHLIFVIEPYIGANEAFSIHYNELCIPIRELRPFELYSTSLLLDTWENVEQSPATYMRQDLYLGENQTVY